MHKRSFGDFKYDSAHWACTVSAKKDDNFIEISRVDNSLFLVKLNPTDSRGYRTIVQYIGEQGVPFADNINKTFNRLYTVEEKIKLFIVTSHVSKFYESLGLVAQIEYAGNNSHELKNGVLRLGKQSEPSVLHSHIICRGDPEYAYIGDVKLRGPIPGELFDMRNGKTKWEPGEMKQVSQQIKKISGSLVDHREGLLWQSMQHVCKKPFESLAIFGVLFFSYVMYKS